MWSNLGLSKPSDANYDPNPEITTQLGPLRATVEGETSTEPEALTLYETRWYSSAETLRLKDVPAVRIPLAAVAAWW